MCCCHPDCWESYCLSSTLWSGFCTVFYSKRFSDVSYGYYASQSLSSWLSQVSLPPVTPPSPLQGCSWKGLISSNHTLLTKLLQSDFINTDDLQKCKVYVPLLAKKKESKSTELANSSVVCKHHTQNKSQTPQSGFQSSHNLGPSCLPTQLSTAHH